MAPIVLSSENRQEKDNFPYEIKDIEPEVNKKLLRNYSGERTGFVQVGPKKYFFPYKYKYNARKIYNFKVRPDDVWVVTFPRSGTTWCQEMVWLTANDFNYQKAAKTSLLLRFPFLEYSLFVHEALKEELLQENIHDPEKVKMVEQMDAPRWEELDKAKSPRFIKSHMPFSLLPPDLLTSGAKARKVVYVARNAKDVVTSYYHLNRLMKTQGFSGDFATHWNYFENDQIAWCPFFEHIKEAWELKANRNLLFLFYEDMKNDMRGSIAKVAKFLNKPLPEQELLKLMDHLDIKNFKNNPSVNFDLLNSIGISVKGEAAFIREGKIGNWKEQFDEELSAWADEWIAKNLENTDIKFPE